MNKQEIYTRVRKHLLTQMQTSVDDGGRRCVYRGKDGLQCAIGCLIPDETYRPELEGQLAGAEDILAAINVPRTLGNVSDEERLLIFLQRTHDLHPPEEWAERLAECIEKFGVAVEP